MSISSEIDRLEAAKSQLAAAITAKGVTVPEAAKLDAYPDYVASIPAGGSPRTYRVVVGTSTVGWTEDDCDYLCTGSNDQAIISQALNDARLFNGGVLYFLEGGYSFSTSISIPRGNITLLGADKNSTFLNNNTGGTMLSTYSNHFTLQGFTITDDRTSNSSNRTVRISGDYFTIRDCNFTNIKVGTLEISGADAFVANSNFLSLNCLLDGHNGLKIYNCTGPLEGENTNTSLCWAQLTGNNILIQNCFIQGSYQTIKFSSCTGLNISNNFILNCSVGIYGGSSNTNCNIIGNIIVNPRSRGIYTFDTTNQYFNISNNIVYAEEETAGSYPIAISGDRCVITSNITPGKEITIMGNRVLIDNNSY